MERPALILLILALALCLKFNGIGATDLVHSTPDPAPHSDPGFDLLLLVRTWSPTFCEQLREQKLECTRPPLADFTLHGLWPEYENGGWPQFCQPDTSQEDEEEEDVESIEEEEEDDDDDSRERCEWPSFHGSTAAFWNHENDKHGTCASPLLGNRTHYMATAMKLHDTYDLNRLFSAARLWPQSNSQGAFTTEAAVEVVQSAWGVAPKLACHKGSLAEVWMCLDLNLKAVECPPRVKPGEQCGQEYRMPPGQQAPKECRQYFPRARGAWMEWPIQWPEAVVIVLAVGTVISAGVELRRWWWMHRGQGSDDGVDDAPLIGEPTAEEVEVEGP